MQQHQQPHAGGGGSGTPGPAPVLATPRAPGAAAPPPPAAFAGYPRSGGLLLLPDLLAALQGAHLYADSKTAVDLALRVPPSELEEQWRRLDTATSDSSSGGSARDALAALVTAALASAGSDVEACQAPDWHPEPPAFLAALQADGSSEAASLRQFGLQLHQLWGLLCRRVSPAVLAHPERHSLLPLPHPTIVPGDRFRETYYWDSFWVVRGLLVSGMQQSARNLVLNLLSMLEAVGHVPNGARTYYLNRSQPPLLSAMVRSVYEASTSSSTGADVALLRQALPLLLLELAYWSRAPKAVTIRAADGTTHSLSRYWAGWHQPRPESYREDVELARSSSSGGADAARLFHELASGAESGWDYSSRWFADNATLATIRTTQVIPADLNAFLFQLESNIAWAAGLLGEHATRQAAEAAARARATAMQVLLWDEAAGMWRDGILCPPVPDSGATADSSSSAVFSLSHNLRVFASNFVPLWVGLTAGDGSRGARVVAALEGSGLVGPAGIAATLYATGQQWDWPNGWPPLQHMLIEGAAQHGGPRGRAFARRLTQVWLDVNMRALASSGCMHEKYDVSQPGGGVGGGGEYAPQVGFGWSNGVALDLLAHSHQAGAGAEAAAHDSSHA